jgi:1-acyl-sn-glycerol-3-phosphate acyltransferase
VVRKRRFGEYNDALVWDRIIRGAFERALPAARRGALIVYHSVTCWGLFCLFTALFILAAPPLWLVLKAGGVENVRPVLQLISHRWHGWYVGMLMQIVTPLRFVFLPPRPAGPGAGPVVYVSNHASVVDLLLLTASIDSFCVMAKRAFRFVPLFGTAMTLLGMIFVDRRRKFESEDVFGVVRARLRAGENVLAFPQGSRTLPFSRRTVKRGLFRVVMEERVPVVPVAIVGTNHILKKGQFLFDLTRRIRATVFFLPPMTPEGDPENLADVTAFRDAVVERIGALLESASDPTRR